MMDMHVIAYYIGIAILLVQAIKPVMNRGTGWMKNAAMSLAPIALIAYYFMWKENMIKF